ncbi:MAG TPA: SRPBCC domain-containing protein [Vicinamibacteria bacterium]|nr:SRPBCC domain-containing protein [Vicinamibacteria bacterium]
MTSLEHVLERTVLIRARPETVFRYFTDSERFAAWWGAGSTIEGRPGGALHIRYPNGVLASGEVIELAPPHRVVFTYGYEDPQKPIRPGGSRVIVTLDERPDGTLVHLRHELADAAARDQHVPGWRYQLAVFANVVAGEAAAGLTPAVDAFFSAWSERDEGRRRALLASVASDGVLFADAFSCTAGVADLAAHLGAAQLHMPGMVLERSGDVRHCQGTAVADWVAKGPGGAARGRGTNVFLLDPDGRFARVVGLWA